MSKSSFVDYLTETINNLEIELDDSKKYSDEEKEIFFDSLYLFSLETQNLDFSFHDCRKNLSKTEHEIQQLKIELEHDFKNEIINLCNHINAITTNLTKGNGFLLFTNKEETSKLIKKIKNKEIDITHIKHLEYIKETISSLKYSRTELNFTDNITKIKPGHIKKYVESRNKVISYISNTLEPILSKHEDIKNKIEEQRQKKDRYIEIENTWKECLNHFFKFEYILDSTHENVLSLRYKGPKKYLTMTQTFNHSKRVSRVRVSTSSLIPRRRRGEY